MRNDAGLIIAIIAILLAVPIFGVMAGDSGEDEESMTTIDVAHSEYVKSAKLDYIGYQAQVGGIDKFRLTIDVLAGFSAEATISVSDMMNCKTSSPTISSIYSSSIPSTHISLLNDFAVSNDSSNLKISSKGTFDTVGTKTYAGSNGSGATIEYYVQCKFNNSASQYNGLIYVTVNVVEPSVSLNTGSEWVTGVPYVNTGSEYVKAKKVFVHDGTGWKLSK